MREPNEIDFWRGFALITIFINHVPGIVFERFTYRNLSLSDAAELFVFLAGWSLRLQMNRAATAALPAFLLRLGRRATQVYFAQLVISALAIAMLAGAAIWFDAGFLLDWHNVSAFFHDPVRAHVGLVLLTHQLGYFNILPLYVVLVAAAPLIVLGARFSMPLLLAGSAVLYATTLVTGVNLPSWPRPGMWFLDPFAWQFIYVLGFVMAGQDGLGAWVRRNRKALMLAALPVVGLGICVALTNYAPRPEDVPSPKLFFLVDKTFLSPARLIHLLALVAIFAGSFGWLARAFAPVTGFCALLGRHSLNVFCAGSLFSLGGQILRAVHGGGLLIDMVIAGVGVAGMAGLAWLGEQKHASRRGLSENVAFVPAPVQGRVPQVTSNQVTSRLGRNCSV